MVWLLPPSLPLKGDDPNNDGAEGEGEGEGVAQVVDDESDDLYAEACLQHNSFFFSLSLVSFALNSPYSRSMN